MARATARRHAQAAFDIALEQDELERWRADMGRMAEAIKDPGLRRLLESPKLPFALKASILSQCLEGINPLAMNLAYLLVARGRLGIVEDMVAQYDRLVDEHQGIAHAEVTAAVPLDNGAKDRLVRMLGDLVGKEIVLRERIDPSIIAGLVARVGDKLIDGSTKSRLIRLRESLIERR